MRAVQSSQPAWSCTTAVVGKAVSIVPRLLCSALVASWVGCGEDDPQPAAASSSGHLHLPGQTAWRDAERGAIRGLTVGPIESALHPDRGYGSAAYRRGLREARRMGATWISVTPFARAWDLEPTGLDLSFEARFEDNRASITRAIEQAHAEGLRVMLVPHLWVETGEWRALIDPKSEEGWRRWEAAYRAFVLAWAEVARDTQVDLLSVGVELRSWVTTTRAPSFVEVIRDVRAVYPGPITYAANWDDVQHTSVLGELDVIGINAFYPLAKEEGADYPTLLAGGRKVREEVARLSKAWNKPVLFTEIGYTTRVDPAVKPWEWPDHMANVVVDEGAQAQAYAALLTPFLDEPWFAGFFVWRVYADPDDTSQEAEWGFNPRGKLAELVVRDAFTAHWAADGQRPLGTSLYRFAAQQTGVY